MEKILKRFAIEWGTAPIVKRAADLLEKLCVGAFIVGVFQGFVSGVIIAIVSAGFSFWLTRLHAGLEKKERENEK